MLLMQASSGSLPQGCLSLKSQFELYWFNGEPALPWHSALMIVFGCDCRRNT
jgi:hypothetical protein